MMLRKLILVVGSMLLLLPLYSQSIYYTKSGQVLFSSDAPLEKIEAINKSFTCVLNSSTGKLQGIVLIKGFEFKKALMQEHFNENYLESDQYPQADFEGSLVNLETIDFKKPGIYPAKVAGSLQVHGQRREFNCNGQLSVEAGQIKLTAVFMLQLADFNIVVPALVRDKIARQVKVVVNARLLPLQR